MMRWRRIPKENTAQPSTGSYRDWKAILAEEGFHQCVYCAIHEVSFGGIRNFHVEHYRPKSKFEHLTNDIRNLFYACSVCNTFKSNDWPSEPVTDHWVQAYPNPSTVDYTELFVVELTSGVVDGRYVASRYMIEKLHLNRSQLIVERRFHHLLLRSEQIRGWIRRCFDQLKQRENTPIAIELRDRLVQMYDKMLSLTNRLHEISPYQNHELK
jgi:5-methylcytosine-specific restriction endonuclease McrA